MIYNVYKMQYNQRLSRFERGVFQTFLFNHSFLKKLNNVYYNLGFQDSKDRDVSKRVRSVLAFFIVGHTDYTKLLAV